MKKIANTGVKTLTKTKNQMKTHILDLIKLATITNKKVKRLKLSKIYFLIL